MHYAILVLDLCGQKEPLSAILSNGHDIVQRGVMLLRKLTTDLF